MTLEDDKIWGEDENSLREMENMIDSNKKHCWNCQWGTQGEKEGDWVTCGYHHSNFPSDSMCCYWTDPKDPKLLAYMERKRQRFLTKLKVNGQ